MSESLRLLKERIYDEGTVGVLLEELGCENVTMNSGRSGDDLVTAQLPDSSNKRSVQIYLNPNLNSYIVNRGIDGDIYAIVGYILYGCTSFDEVRSHLYQIKTYITNTLGYEDLNTNDFEKPAPKTDWNWWLRDIQKQRSREYELTNNPLLDERVLSEFVAYPWFEWYQEGISIDTQKLFGIGYHVASERVTIPIHNAEGKLIGIKGRYSGSDPEIKQHKKYSYIYPCSKSIEVFNLFRALPYIKEQQKVIVVEGAKTTMKLWSWGIKNAVSIEGDKLSPVQVMLLKSIGLDIDIIGVWDKGKDEEFVLKQLRQIKGRRVYYLMDNADRFHDKQSPTDLSYEVFMDLYQNDLHLMTR